jgi:hypothetical protein
MSDTHTDLAHELMLARAEISWLKAVIDEQRAVLDRRHPEDGDGVQLEILELRGELARVQLELKKLGGQVHLMRQTMVVIR